MTALDEGLQAQAWLRRGGAFVEDADEIVFQQCAHLEVGVASMKVRTESYRQIQAAITQCLGRDVGLELMHINYHRKLGTREALQQARQHQLLEVFRSAEVENRWLLGGIEL
ncbi:hypothetical protein D3C76_807570 [compost metagenome]